MKLNPCDPSTYPKVHQLIQNLQHNESFGGHFGPQPWPKRNMSQEEHPWDGGWRCCRCGDWPGFSAGSECRLSPPGAACPTMWLFILTHACLGLEAHTMLLAPLKKVLRVPAQPSYYDLASCFSNTPPGFHMNHLTARQPGKSGAISPKDGVSLAKLFTPASQVPGGQHVSASWLC